MLGIMQGRLVPPIEGRIQAFPRERWASEFAHAASAGIEAIEWIYDAYGLGANPIESSQGVAHIQQLSRDHNVAVRSVCADYFMDFAFVRASDAERTERIERLVWLMSQTRLLGVTRIVLPFVDQSAIRDEADREAVVDVLSRVVPSARATHTEIHLETSLPPDEFGALLACLPDPQIKVNYDSGNSSSLGYRPTEEFAAYGQRVGSVHIKDRICGGTTVPLGQGDADFDSLFHALRALDYAGDFVLQVARGADGDEIAWSRQNAAFLKRYWD